MFKALRRLRNSRGFGVHSPYGYSFVKSVIDPPHGYQYYAEEDLDTHLTNDPERYRLLPESRTLLRIVAFTRPSRVFLPKNANKIFRLAVRGAGAHIKLTDRIQHLQESDLAAVSGSGLPLDVLKDYLKFGSRTLLIKDIPQDWTESLFEAMPEGILFEGPVNSIFLSRPGIWKVRYLMNL